MHGTDEINTNYAKTTSSRKWVPHGKILGPQYLALAVAVSLPKYLSYY